jgi:hypothetical protein
MTSSAGDNLNIPSYNRNLLVAMTPCIHEFEFSVFDFIWGGDQDNIGEPSQDL